MQEEVTQRTVALCVEATKLSAGMLQQVMKKVLDEMAERRDRPQDQTAPRQADPPAAYEAQLPAFPTSKSPTRTSGPFPHRQEVRH